MNEEVDSKDTAMHSINFNAYDYTKGLCYYYSTILVLATTTTTTTTTTVVRVL